MAIDEEERRYLFDRIAEVTDERAARAMNEMFDDAEGEDPGIIARFDQQDAALGDLSGRMDRVEHAVTDLSGRMDRVEHAVTDLSARMDRVEHAVTDLSGRMDRVEHAVTDLSNRVGSLESAFQQSEIRIEAKLDGFRADMEGLLHREIGGAIAAQTRTVLVGILAVTASMFGMLLAMNQLL